MTGATLIGAVLLGLGALHVVYTYAAYPWLVSRLPRRAPKLPNQVTTTPNLVSVIIAARVNSQAQIQGLVGKVRQLLGTIWLPCEVIVAVDGSSGALATALQAIGDPRLRIVTLPANSGKAIALNQAMRRSKRRIFGAPRRCRGALFFCCTQFRSTKEKIHRSVICYPVYAPRAESSLAALLPQPKETRHGQFIQLRMRRL